MDRLCELKSLMQAASRQCFLTQRRVCHAIENSDGKLQRALIDNQSKPKPRKKKR